MTDADFQAWCGEAHGASILSVAQQLEPRLKRTGADWTGPCPAGCASSDGFAVHPSKGVFLCRPSGETGGVVKMVQHARSCSFVEAAEFITGREKPGPQSKPISDEERAEREARRAAQIAANERRQADQEKAEQSKAEGDKARVAALWAQRQPFRGSHAEAYLKARGLNPPSSLTRDLYFVPDVEYWAVVPGEERKRMIGRFPIMLAPIKASDGTIVGLHRTFLDPKEPRKITPPEGNKAKKMMGQAMGGMIRLGPVEPVMAIAEGIETALSWHALGFGPDDCGLAAAGSLGNLSGSCTGTLAHPTLKGPDGKPRRYPNGKPDMEKPGLILPDVVREVILIGDGDSEPFSTMGRLLAAGRRWQAEGRTVSYHIAPTGLDWGDVLERDLGIGERRAAA